MEPEAKNCSSLPFAFTRFRVEYLLYIGLSSEWFSHSQVPINPYLLVNRPTHLSTPHIWWVGYTSFSLPAKPRCRDAASYLSRRCPLSTLSDEVDETQTTRIGKKAESSPVAPTPRLFSFPFQPLCSHPLDKFPRCQNFPYRRKP